MLLILAAGVGLWSIAPRLIIAQMLIVAGGISSLLPSPLALMVLAKVAGDALLVRYGAWEFGRVEEVVVALSMLFRV